LTDSLSLASSCKQTLNSKIQESTRSNTDKGTGIICQLIFLSDLEQTKTIAQITIFLDYAAN
jgi:hypothetical protein